MEERTMEKLDLRKQLKHLYNPSKKAFQLVDVPAMNFVMIDGQGDPNNSESFVEATQALYAVSYTLKFEFKKNHSVDYPVMALEGLWWADDMEVFRMERRSDWKWTLMMMQPDVVKPTHFRAARDQAMAKKDLAALNALRFERFREGLSAQIMYLGPYANEGPTITRMHEFIEEMVGEREEEFVDFFNNAQPINTRLHQLELLPGFGKKHTHEIVEARKGSPFKNFDDIKERVKSVPDPRKANVNFPSGYSFCL